MNIKRRKLNILAFGAMFVLLILAVALLTTLQPSEHRRKLASLMDQANPDWSPGQKLKWAVTKQFQIEITDQNLTVANPLSADLCFENHGISLKLIASDTMISGQNPQINILISCDNLLKKTDFKFSVATRDLKQLHQVKELQLNDLKLSRFALYKDEEWPTDWTLAEIEIIGPNGFVINQYELQEAQQKLFDLTLND